jgi:hypothetical protein
MGPLSRGHVNEMNFSFGVKTGSGRNALAASAAPQKPDHPLRCSELTLCATLRLMHRSNPILFDDLVGSSEQRRWNGNAKCLRGLEIDD